LIIGKIYSTAQREREREREKEKCMVKETKNYKYNKPKIKN